MTFIDLMLCAFCGHDWLFFNAPYSLKERRRCKRCGAMQSYIQWLGEWR